MILSNLPVADGDVEIHPNENTSPCIAIIRQIGNDSFHESATFIRMAPARPEFHRCTTLSFSTTATVVLRTVSGLSVPLWSSGSLQHRCANHPSSPLFSVPRISTGTKCLSLKPVNVPAPLLFMTVRNGQLASLISSVSPGSPPPVRMSDRRLPQGLPPAWTGECRFRIARMSRIALFPA